MRTFALFLFAVVTITSSMARAEGVRRLKVGDLVFISSPGASSGEIPRKIEASGHMLIGQVLIRIAGLTPAEASKRVSERLRRYIGDPGLHVQVVVAKYSQVHRLVPTKKDRVRSKPPMKPFSR